MPVDATAARRYVGEVVVAQGHVSYLLSHDQCERGELPPDLGDCVQLTDFFFNDGCAPCLESLSVTDGVSTAVA